MNQLIKKCAVLCSLTSFLVTTIIPLNIAQAQNVASVLPQAGSMVHLSPAFYPTVLRGIEINRLNPFEFNFIVEQGQDAQTNDEFQAQTDKLVRYFMAALTMPEKDMWVNLSPYESDRIIPDNFGVTDMGRDLLAQDYLLKQITSTLMHPEGEKGKVFWDSLYKKVYDQTGGMDMPADTFHKIWIVPGEINITENKQGAFVTSSSLKIMLEEDMMDIPGGDKEKSDDRMTTALMREHIVPVIEKEVNEGTHFAPLRQIYQSLALATWYKMRLKNTIIGQQYVDQQKVGGIDDIDPVKNQEIYDQYVEAFKKGVFDFIKEEKATGQDEMIPRRYFSGGWSAVGMINAIKRRVGNLSLSTIADKVKRVYKRVTYSATTTGLALGAYAFLLAIPQQIQAQSVEEVRAGLSEQAKSLFDSRDWFRSTRYSEQEIAAVKEYANGLTIKSLTSGSSVGVNVKIWDGADEDNIQFNIVTDGRLMWSGENGDRAGMYAIKPFFVQEGAKEHMILRIEPDEYHSSFTYVLFDPDNKDTQLTVLKTDAGFKNLWQRTDRFNDRSFESFVGRVLIMAQEGKSTAEMMATVNEVKTKGVLPSGMFLSMSPDNKYVFISTEADGVEELSSRNVLEVTHTTPEEKTLPAAFTEILPTSSDGLVESTFERLGLEGESGDDFSEFVTDEGHRGFWHTNKKGLSVYGYITSANTYLPLGVLVDVQNLREIIDEFGKAYEGERSFYSPGFSGAFQFDLEVRDAEEANLFVFSTALGILDALNYDPVLLERNPVLGEIVADAIQSQFLTEEQLGVIAERLMSETSYVIPWITDIYEGLNRALNRRILTPENTINMSIFELRNSFRAFQYNDRSFENNTLTPIQMDAIASTLPSWGDQPSLFLDWAESATQAHRVPLSPFYADMVQYNSFRSNIISSLRAIVNGSSDENAVARASLLYMQLVRQNIQDLHHPRLTADGVVRASLWRHLVGMLSPESREYTMPVDPEIAGQPLMSPEYISNEIEFPDFTGAVAPAALNTMQALYPYISFDVLPGFHLPWFQGWSSVYNNDVIQNFAQDLMFSIQINDDGEWVNEAEFQANVEAQLRQLMTQYRVNYETGSDAHRHAALTGYENRIKMYLLLRVLSPESVVRDEVVDLIREFAQYASDNDANGHHELRGEFLERMYTERGIFIVDGSAMLDSNWVQERVDVLDANLIDPRFDGAYLRIVKGSSALMKAPWSNNDRVFTLEMNEESTPDEIEAAIQDFIKNNQDFSMTGMSLFTNVDRLKKALKLQKTSEGASPVDEGLAPGGIKFDNALQSMKIDYDSEEGFTMDSVAIEAIQEGVKIPDLKPMFIGVQPYNLLQFSRVEGLEDKQGIFRGEEPKPSS